MLAAFKNLERDHKVIFASGLLFVLINAVALSLDMYYLILLPIIGLGIWAAISRLDSLLLFVVFCAPISINLEEMNMGGVGFYLPTEPILFGVLLLFILKMLTGKSIDPRIFKHPISYVIYAYLGWMFLTCISSKMPMVSFKFLTTRLWFIASFYFLATHMFQNWNNLKKYLWLYLIPLSAVVIYTLVRHAGFGFDKDSGHWVMSPFFKDHTSYGAVLAMFVPVSISLVWLMRRKLVYQTAATSLLVIICIGLVFSFTRAAWVSLAAAGGLFLALRLRIKLNQLIVGLSLFSAFIYLSYDSLLINLERNDSESSDNLTEHIESISNVSSDASNLERLNRWDCAWQMFINKPILGWGPGTYQFQYAPFQRSENLTIISTKNADGGNAHSEYLGPLAESGVIGMLMFIILIYSVCRLGFRLYRNMTHGTFRVLALSFFLGWFTYIVHGVLNNYLDTDKASIPFWGFIAALVAIDLYHSGNETSEDSGIIDESAVS